MGYDPEYYRYLIVKAERLEARIEAAEIGLGQAMPPKDMLIAKRKLRIYKDAMKQHEKDSEQLERLDEIMRIAEAEMAAGQMRPTIYQAIKAQACGRGH